MKQFFIRYRQSFKFGADWSTDGPGFYAIDDGLSRCFGPYDTATEALAAVTRNGGQATLLPAAT